MIATMKRGSFTPGTSADLHALSPRTWGNMMKSSRMGLNENQENALMRLVIGNP